jgi:hypothetical protein
MARLRASEEEADQPLQESTVILIFLFCGEAFSGLALSGNP